MLVCTPVDASIRPINVTTEVKESKTSADHNSRPSLDSKIKDKREPESRQKRDVMDIEKPAPFFSCRCVPSLLRLNTAKRKKKKTTNKKK